MRIIDYSAPGGAEALKSVLNRTQIDYGDTQAVVDDIIKNVRTRGDEALLKYTEKFDKVKLTAEELRVTDGEIRQAYTDCGCKLTEIIQAAARRIREFHEKQKRTGFIDTYPGGEVMGQLVLPIEKAGVYCPGGTAAYPSSVLMNIIPAKIAGVSKIIMCTPPGDNGRPNPAILAAADIAGADEIYKIGGAQAIAAMAFGTQTIPRTYKITGPGNIFVAIAKRAVYGYAGIDSVAGPSEILIIADETANPRFIAADLLSQAEHDPLAAAILLTTSRDLAESAVSEVNNQLETAQRKETAKASLAANGAAVTVENLAAAYEISNEVAPEHLEICISDPLSALPYIKNAGAVFLGNYTPESLGDYMAGPNHILPTSGTARFFSPLCVDDFYKKTSVLHFSKNAFDKLADDTAAFALAEGLYAHARAVTIRQE